jgi:hypothetical protein
MGRIPPDFFIRAVSLAPNRIGITIIIIIIFFLWLKISETSFLFNTALVALKADHCHISA